MGQDTEGTEIPGLLGITEEPDESGQTRFIFELDDDKVGQFYAAFGLQPGDEVGFRRVLLESIEMLIARQRASDAGEERGA